MSCRSEIDSLLLYIRTYGTDFPVSFTNASQVADAKRDLVTAEGWLVKDMNNPYFDQPLLLLYR